MQKNGSAGMPLILVTGATGYVGGRLLPALLDCDCRLRCLVRRPDALALPDGAVVDVVQGDALMPDSLARALAGVDTAYYLLHSLASGPGFAEKDRVAAQGFADAAREMGVRRIIYLGGLGESTSALSAHLRSRQEVGEILRTSGAQVIEFRASVVIGFGSLSFEMVRALTERLPVMVTPKWVSIPAQPIYISDVLLYLAAALDFPEKGNRIFEIGGADVVSYREIMRVYAEVRCLRRIMLPVPVLTPWLSSLWLGLVTPLFARIGRQLIEGIRSSTIVRDDTAAQLFDIRPIGIREAIESALKDQDGQYAQTSFSSFFAEPHGSRRRSFGSWIIDSRCEFTRAGLAEAYAVVSRIGGANGYFYANWLWRVRGLLDMLVGGVGLSRGRPDPLRLTEGDIVDWWRVERVEPGRGFRLRAEMRVPGRAWLDFELTPEKTGTRVRQTAVFDPSGLTGIAYWHTLRPAHGLVFSGMLRRVARMCDLAASGRER